MTLNYGTSMPKVPVRLEVKHLRSEAHCVADIFFCRKIFNALCRFQAIALLCRQALCPNLLRYTSESLVTVQL